tara:strand:+ start:456 stop:716 length:261 start_codon:yes stop_codon:yes gene_type:complete
MNPEITPEPNVIVKKSSNTEAQKRANKKWRVKNIEKSREYARKYAKKNYEKNKEILREKSRLNYYKKKQRLIDEKTAQLKNNLNQI